MKVIVEISPVERAMINAGSERAARDTARRIWPDMDPKVRNAVVTLIRAGTIEDDQ